MRWLWLTWVVGSVALLLSVPAGATVLTSEVALGEAYGVPANNAMTPHAASGRDQALAIYVGPRNRLAASRISQDGTVLDVPGLPLGIGDAYPSRPQVASDGNNYLVVWDELGDSGAINWGQVVRHDGAVGAPFIIASGSDVMGEYVVRHDGTHYVIVGYGSHASVVARRFGKHGQPVGKPRDIVAAPFGTWALDAALTKGRGLFVWGDVGGVWGIPFNVKGRPLRAEPTLLLATADVHTVSVASDGEGFYVVVNSGDYESEHGAIVGIHVGLDGLVSREPAVLTEEESLYARVAGSTAGYLASWVSWDDGCNTYCNFTGIRVTGLGDPEPASAGALGPNTSFVEAPRILPWGAGWLAVSASGGVVYGNEFSGPDDDDTPWPLSLVKNSQSHLEVVWDGKHFVSAWFDSPGGYNVDTIGTARIGPRGRLFDKEPRVISTATPTLTFKLSSVENGTVQLTRYSPATGLTTAPLSARGIYGPELEFAAPFAGRLDLFPLGSEYRGVLMVSGADGVIASQLITLDERGRLLGQRQILLNSPQAGYPFDLGGALKFAAMDGEQTLVLDLDDSGEATNPRVLANGMVEVCTASSGDAQFVATREFFGELRVGSWGAEHWAHEPFVLDNDVVSHQVVWDGSQFWVFWTSRVNFENSTFAQAFSRDGVPTEQIVLPPVNAMSVASDREGHVALTYLKWSDDESLRAFARVLDTTR